MDTENLFIIDAKNIVKISSECIDDTINKVDDIGKKNAKIKKIRTNYKYEQGSTQFYKDTNYANNYYNTNKKTIRCTICNSPIITHSMKRHLKSQKCLNNTIK